MQKHLFILCGLPFVGKTTLAKTISKQFDLPHVDLDMINRKRGIGVKGRNVTTQEWIETYEISYKQTVDFLNKGKSVVYDATNFTIKQRRKLKQLAIDNNAKPIIIYIDISDKEARRRLAENRKKNLRYDVKDEDFAEVANNFQPPTDEEGLLLTYSQKQSVNNWIKSNLFSFFNKENIIIKSQKDLTNEEKRQIESSVKREFGTIIRIEEKQDKEKYFLLKKADKILASGGLVEIIPVIFDKVEYSILGIGGIVANKKRRGYGKQIIMAIKNYLIDKRKTGIGFCASRNKGFYEKCGFNVDNTSIKRFVFKKNGKKVTNQGDDCVIYLDSSDKFMFKVLSKPYYDVILPRSPNW